MSSAKRQRVDNDSEVKKVVLAYSGGLDTTVILKWLSEKGFEVICYCASIGQDKEDFEAVKAKALSTGASKVYIEDLREEFVKDYIFEAVKANGIYESKYLLGTSIARPVIAKRQVEIAQKEGAQYVAHGATGKGNDQVRFEMCAQALDASITTIAPWRDPEFLEKFKGRSDLIKYSQEHGIPVSHTTSSEAPYSMDDNLFHVSYESGMLEDPMTAPMKEMWRMTVDPKDAPDSPTLLRIEFLKGIPVKVTNKTDGTEKTDALDMFTYLNEVAGANGVGRIDIVENRFVGIKSRGCYETPAGTVLRAAHLDLEGITLDREVLRIKLMMEEEFARLCYNGFWFAPEMGMVRNSIDYSQQHVEGAVELELYKGNVTVLGRESPKSLYSADLASMDIDDGGEGFDYNPGDSQGFIKINSVRLKCYHHLRKDVEK
mmetsp:Transcript_13948/g.18294  ORF Transcript_13948/g.18294 Transcript_13948/m.18294 type:complete len:431 (+) Transcript_13948:101-1393(+)